VPDIVVKFTTVVVNNTTTGAAKMIDKLFGSKLRAKILAWLFSHTDERYFVRQLKGILQEDAANISRELLRMTDMGILICQIEGQQKYYQANKNCPIFAELQGLVLKTAGLVDVLREALKPLSKKIKTAFVYGSFAASSAKAQSDVDLMVIGNCDFSEIVEALMVTQNRLGREVNPTVYPVDEFRKKLAVKHHFLQTVLKEPKIFLIGDENELAKLAR
jgi:DNA-binding transcriptional ArsR family regulator